MAGYGWDGPPRTFKELETPNPRRAKHQMRWKRLDAPGQEDAELFPFKYTWQLRGRVSTTFDGTPASIRYTIGCHGWEFGIATIVMRWRDDRRRLVVIRDRKGRWTVAKQPRPDLSPCEDIDLSVTPSTNTLPIRRLAMEVGDYMDATAAWVRFPELTVEPLRQRYTRIAANRYRYENLDSGFVADLETDDDGIVVLYPNLWARA